VLVQSSYRHTAGCVVVLSGDRNKIIDCRLRHPYDTLKYMMLDLEIEMFC